MDDDYRSDTIRKKMQGAGVATALGCCGESAFPFGWGWYLLLCFTVKS